MLTSKDMSIPHVAIETTRASMLDYMASEDAEARRWEILRDQLTPRERQVMRLIAEGHSNKIIGAKLNISEHTAKFHVAGLFKKLKVDTRAQVAVIAVKVGLA